MQGDVRARLSDAIGDAHRGTGNYGYYIDHSGDGTTGDVVYSCNGDVRMCSYEISTVGDKSTTHLDMENSRNVVPTTTYQEEADEDDHYASMEEAYKRDGLYTSLPLYERFISKKERDAASEDDFAGKGKSYPILEPGDVQAAVHAMGRAGEKNVGTSTLKSRIIAIAKRKGWTKYLPKAWQGDTTKESSVSRGTLGALKLVESWDCKDQALQLVEASGNPSLMKIKLISPGKGSSAFYPAEVLKRDGPNVFTKGTHIYINHATQTEESARPEGDWHKLAGALNGNAYWDESAKQGPGLYGDALFTSDYAPLIKEKAPFTGMSIRASGVAESGKSKDGLPVLKELTSAESVDVVTRAGAGGMILTEAARSATQEVSDMDAAALTKLQESLNAGLASLALREAKADAKDKALALLESVSLPQEVKAEIVSRCLESVPMKDGSLDEAKFKESVEAETKRIGKLLSALSGGGRVFGNGLGAPTGETDPVKIKEAEKAQRKSEKRLREAETETFGRLMGGGRAAELAAGKEAA